MRILMLVPQAFFSPRGTPISAYHRTRELLEAGHSVDILTYPVGTEPPGLSATIYRSRGPHFSDDIGQGPSRLKIWFDLLFFFNTIYRLARSRYDLVYAHEEGAFIARIVKPLFRIPYVYDMHSSLPRQVEEWNFSDARWVVNLFRWVEKVAVKSARVIVAISPAVADVARAIDPEKTIVVLPNKFEIDSSGDPASAGRLRESLALRPDEKLIVYTGSFVALQALDLLVNAIPAVVEQVPDCRFVLVGGRDQEIGELSALAKSLGVEDRLLLLTARPQSEMPAFLDIADVLVSPRVRGINPPGKLFAYLASGKPIVATDTLVHNQFLARDSAILTAPTSAGLAAGIVTAITDREVVARVRVGADVLLRDVFGETARRRALDELLAAANAS